MPTGAARSDMNGAHERAGGHHDGGWETSTLSKLSPGDGAAGMFSTGTPSLPPERWLRDDTVDELRDSRGRIGLARPARAPSVPRPPLAEAPARISSYRAARSITPPGASRLFMSLAAGAVIGLLIGILAALVIHPTHLPIPGL